MTLKGTYNEVVKQITSETGLTEQVAGAVVNLMLQNPDVADTADVERGDDQFKHGSSELVFGGERYYISLKRTIVPLLLLLIPIKHYAVSGIDLEMIMGAIMSISGFMSGGGFDDRKVTLNERNGEKCILLEVLKNKRDSVTADIIKKQMGNRCEKQYTCDYKRNGRCTCDKEMVEKILDTLLARKILKGGPAGYSYVE